MNYLRISFLSLSTIFFIACGSADHSAEEQTDTAMEESHEGHDHGDMQSSGMGTVADAPAGARVFFENLQEGATVSSPVHIVMGAEGINVHPAGEVIEGTGHHHIIVDGGPTPKGEAVPADETHIHFGGGQTEFDLPLTPGSHKLTLQFADGLHRSYGEALSATINVTVK